MMETIKKEGKKTKFSKLLYIFSLIIFIGIVGFRISQNIYLINLIESSSKELDGSASIQDVQIREILRLNYGSTTTTIAGTTTTTIAGTTTTTTQSTTTTTISLALPISCAECYQETECKCEFEGTCDQGTWGAKNKDGTPLDEPVLQEVPPEEFKFTPNDTGKVDVKIVCTQPPKPTGEPRINTTTVEVKLKFLDCPDECAVDDTCTCDVNGCNNGKFTATQGDTVLLRKSITTESFEADFTPLSTKEISADVTCVDPVKTDSKKIFVSGELPPTEDFQGSNFICSSTSSGFKCSLDYTNNLHEKVVIVFTFAKPEVITTKEVTVSSGSGQASATFSCSSASGTIYVSWRAYKLTDRKNAISWSTSTERQTISC